ncbi:MAG: filamentous hemagglutinin N-terminal domain-containing protein, partial [Planctomycetes bacterium]|nr:filamentous hemagglutinin N-terminal domain-containing protein [Planctomycetota bacterium]
MGFFIQLVEKKYLRRFITYTLICCMLFNLPASVVLAGPEGAEVIHGQVSLQQSGLNTVIHASDKSVINYTSFDIARPEVVQFIQPGSNASVLNRILSANPTCIDGTLLANGRVFFVNPAGVIIGSGATINVNQLVASGLNISNDSFINGQYEFVGGGGSVANYGDISAQSVYLVGKQVTNAGNINCPAGYVVMAAGDRVFLGQPGSNIIVEIGSFEPPDQADAQAPAEIINEGTVEAEGGTIILAAAGDAFSRPIISNIGSLSTSNANGNAGNISFQVDEGGLENIGIITATSNSDAGGTITAVAGEIINTGTIDATGSQGGTVTLGAAGRLGQFSTVNADGIESDGGQISLTAGNIVALSSESVTTANARVNGDGGDVIVYSPDTALFRNGALIETKGGSISGDGGFVEVSGIEHVEVFGSVDASAANGESGQFLIDPRNITINNSSNVDGGFTGPAGEWEPSSDDSEFDIVDLEEFLGLQNVTITTSGSGSQEGWVHFDAGRDLYDGLDHVNGSGFSLTVIADDYILLDSGIHFNSSGNVTLDAASDITLNANIFLNSGLFTAHAGNSSQSGILSINQDITAGSISLTADNGIDVMANLAAISGITLTGLVHANGGNQVFDAGVGMLWAQDSITKTTAGDLSLGGDAGIDLDGTVDVQSGDLIITDDVDAESDLEASGLIWLQDTGSLGSDVTATGSDITFDAAVVADGGDQVFDAGSGTLWAKDTITKTGTGDLTLSGDTLVDLDGAIDIQSGSLTVNSAIKASLADNITTLNNQTYNADAELVADVIMESTNNVGIDFLSTIDGITNGGQELTVKTGGVTKFHDEIGSIKPLEALVIDAGGQTEIGAVTINLNGNSATFNDHVLLTDNLTINEAGGGDIEFASTVDSESGNNYTLTVNSGSGTTIFTGAVGSDALGVDSQDDGLGSVTTNAAGSTQINGGLVTTTGDQTYNDSVTLGSAVTVLNGSNVEFAGTLNGASALTVNTTGNGSTVFGSTVGNTGIGLLSLETNADGDTQINGGLVTTTGDQTYNDPVTLGDDTTLNGTNVTFSNTLDSDSGNKRSLLVNASGVTTFDGLVGGTDRLSHLETDGAGSTEIGAVTINLDGTSAKFGDPVLLTDNLTINEAGADNIEFSDTVDGAYDLTVNTAGLTKFGGEVGGTTALTNLETDSSGDTQINGGLVTTTGDQTYNDSVTLGSAATVLNGSNVEFAGTLNGAS